MRRLFIAGEVLLACLWTAGPLYGSAQEANTSSQASTQQQSSDQTSGEAHAGKEQKKPDGKTQKNAKAETKVNAQAQPSSSGQATHSTADENPFPEQVSRDAAKSAGPAPASSKPSTSPTPSTADSNPFPEAVSRSAAKGAGSSSDDSDESQSPNPPNQPPPLPPGVSSSQASALTRESAPGSNASKQDQNSLEVTNQARAKKDTQVGNYYLAAGNPQGAYLRYRDAIASDPTNVDAIFGLAEAARQLHKFAEAERNYQIYLAITHDGRKAKAAAKALHSLTGQK